MRWRRRRALRSVAILAIDLDRFKIVNDTYGHGTGDRVLKIAAERMSGALRSSDVLSRFGGDEFVVLLMPAARRPPNRSPGT